MKQEKTQGIHVWQQTETKKKKQQKGKTGHRKYLFYRDRKFSLLRGYVYIYNFLKSVLFYFCERRGCNINI